MKKEVALITVISFGASAQDYPNFNPSTGELDIPYLQLGSRTFEATLLYRDDVFILASGKNIPSTNIATSEINGTYDGLSNFPGIFQTDSTDITLIIEGDSIEVTLEKFFTGECRLTGTVADDNSNASGDYDCSDFTSGAWESSRINLENNLLFADFEFNPSDSESFQFQVIGF